MTSVFLAVALLCWIGLAGRLVQSLKVLRHPSKRPLGAELDPVVASPREGRVAGSLLSLAALVWLGLSEAPEVQAQDTLADGTAWPDCPHGAEVRASEVLVLIEHHESYLVVEQAWSLTGPGTCRVRLDGPAEGGLVFELPRGADAIHVIGPGEPEALVMGDRILFTGPVEPRTDGSMHAMPTLSFRFSIPHQSRDHVYSQPVPVAVEQAMVILPLQTDFPRHPDLDVELWVPICRQGDSRSDVICFGAVEAMDTGAPPLAYMDRRVAREGRGAAGSILAFETRGWPAPGRIGRLVVALACALTLVGGLVALFRRREADRAKNTTEEAERDVHGAEENGP